MYGIEKGLRPRYWKRAEGCALDRAETLLRQYGGRLDHGVGEEPEVAPGRFGLAGWCGRGVWATVTVPDRHACQELADAAELAILAWCIRNGFFPGG